MTLRAGALGLRTLVLDEGSREFFEDLDDLSWATRGRDAPALEQRRARQGPGSLQERHGTVLDVHQSRGGALYQLRYGACGQVFILPAFDPGDLPLQRGGRGVGGCTDKDFGVLRLRGRGRAWQV